MKTRPTILHILNKIIVLVFHPNCCPYDVTTETRMFYDIWRHNHWFDVQLEPRAPTRDLAHVLPIFIDEIFFQLFSFIEINIPGRFYNPCKFSFSHTEWEREERDPCLSCLLKYICSILFVKKFRKFEKLTLHFFTSTCCMWSLSCLKYNTTYL